MYKESGSTAHVELNVVRATTAGEGETRATVSVSDRVKLIDLTAITHKVTM